MASSETSGIGRIAYLFLTLGLWIVVGLLFVLLVLLTPLTLPSVDSGEQLEGWVLMFIAVAAVANALVTICAVFLRLRNLGMTTWWMLGLLLPFIDLWLIWRMLACPAGYADHRELDLYGKVVSLIILLPVLVPAAVFIIGMLTSLINSF